MNWVRQCFSDKDGFLSSKRIFGGIAYFVAMGCIVYLCVKEGGTSITESLITMLMVTAMSLLGLGTVTRAFRKNNTVNSNPEDNEDN